MEQTRYTLPAIALRGLTVLPKMMIHFDISRTRSVAAVEKAMVEDQKVFLITQRRAEVMESRIRGICTRWAVWPL